jgi:nucleotide-binding universal stress UspA family protein
MKLPNIHIKKILYATDLSETSVHAFAYAVSLAGTYGAGITILHVLAEFPGENYVSNMINPDTWKQIKEKHYSEAREKLIGKRRDHMAMQEVLHAFSEEAKDNAADQPFATDEIVVQHGEPADVIMNTAAEHRCDLIVMGTHGHGAIADALLGGTARRVVRESKIPVMVVRLPEEES